VRNEWPNVELRLDASHVGIRLATKPDMRTSTPPRPAAQNDAGQEPSTRADGEAMPPDALDPHPANDPAELDDPLAGTRDKEAGPDDPRQRPITDNKAGG
jgi:hypothetical protein